MKRVICSLAIATLVTVSIVGPAFAQRTARDMMNEMREKHGKTFEDCQSLAVSRGYNLNDNENDSRAVAMFVEGCIMGRQR